MNKLIYLCSVLIFNIYFIYIAFFALINGIFGIQYFFKEPLHIQLWFIVIMLYGLWLIVLSLTKHSYISKHLSTFVLVTLILITAHLALSYSIGYHDNTWLTLFITFIYFGYCYYMTTKQVS